MIRTTTTLEAFFQDFYHPQKLVTGQPATIESYQSTLNQLTRFAGRPAQLDDINEAFVGRFLAWLLTQNRSRATLNKHLRHIRALLNLAEELHAIPKPPRLRPVAEYKTDPEAWTLEQFQAILHAAQHWPDYVGPTPAKLFWPALLLFVTNTGLRISATMAVKTSSLDRSNRLITSKAPTQKQKADQTFELLPETIEALDALDPWTRKLPTLFEDWPHDRTKRQWQTLSEHLGRILAAAGMRATRIDKFHRLRRTFATLIVANGGTVEQAQTLLGHSSPAVTRRYLDPRQIKPPSAAALLGRLERSAE